MLQEKAKPVDCIFQAEFIAMPKLEPD